MSDQLPICPRRQPSGVCLVASDLSGHDVIPWERSCTRCTACDVPQEVNFVTASLAYYSWHIDGDDDKAMQLKQEFLKRGLFAVGVESPLRLDGPGTRLHRRLESMGYAIEPDCTCLQWIRKMNQHCSEWTRQHIADISAAMLKEFRRRQPVSSRLIPDSVLTLTAKRLILAACREWDKFQNALEK